MRVKFGFTVFVLVFCLYFPVTAENKIGPLLKESNQHFDAGNLRQSILKMQAAVGEIWQKAGLWVERSELVSQKTEGFGMFRKRADNVYRPGEPIWIYMEPMGYTHRLRSDGQFEFGMSVDFLLKDDQGSILGGQENFQRIAMVSHLANKEMFLSLTYNLSGVPAGKYELVTVVNDLYGNTKAQVSNPLVIK